MFCRASVPNDLINIRKAWNLTIAYSLSRGSCKTLHTRINNECPRRYANRCKAQRKNTYQGAFIALLFRVCEILQDFVIPKQAPINAFYYVCYPPPAMSDIPRRRFTVTKLHFLFYMCKKILPSITLL